MDARKAGDASKAWTLEADTLEHKPILNSPVNTPMHHINQVVF